MTAQSGAIAFSIDSEVADQVIPVVIAADAASTNTDPDLDLDDDNLPTEAFGIGGQKNWIPAEAAVDVDPDAGTVVQVKHR